MGLLLISLQAMSTRLAASIINPLAGSIPLQFISSVMLQLIVLLVRVLDTKSKLSPVTLLTYEREGVLRLVKLS